MLSKERNHRRAIGSEPQTQLRRYRSRRIAGYRCCCRRRRCRHCLGLSPAQACPDTHGTGCGLLAIPARGRGADERVTVGAGGAGGAGSASRGGGHVPFQSSHVAHVGGFAIGGGTTLPGRTLAWSGRQRSAAGALFNCAGGGASRPPPPTPRVYPGTLARVVYRRHCHRCLFAGGGRTLTCRSRPRRGRPRCRRGIWVGVGT
jgi:hypothetical protein